MRTLLLALTLLVPQGYEEDVAKLEEEGLKAATGPAKVTVGDSYLKLLGKYPKRRQDSTDAASGWYAKAWPDLDDKEKLKLKAKLERLYASPVPRPARAFSAKGWSTQMGTEYAPTTIVSTRVHSGFSAVMVAPKGEGTKLILASRNILVSKGDKIGFSAWFLSDGTDEVDSLTALIEDDTDKRYLELRLRSKRNLPIWQKASAEGVCPEGVTKIRVTLDVGSAEGTLFLDDVSVVVNGKESAKNGSFEER